MDYIRSYLSQALVQVVNWGISQMSIEVNQFNQGHRSLYGPSNDTYVPNEMVKAGAKLGIQVKLEHELLHLTRTLD